jgi:SAM-dependent methyltransferase
MRISKGSKLYAELYEIVAQRPSLNLKSNRYINRYLEMKQVDWEIWHEFTGLVLDVACDIPVDAMILSQMPLVKAIYLVDLRLPPSQVVPEKAHFIQSDATRLSFLDDAFDVVTSFSAVEHLPDPDMQHRWIREMVRVTKPGGKLLITVDNAWSWLNRIWDGYRPTMRRISPRELRRWVMEEGNMEIESVTAGGLYYWGFRPPWPGAAKIAYLFDRILNPLSPLLPWLGNRVGYRFRKL